MELPTWYQSYDCDKWATRMQEQWMPYWAQDQFIAPFETRLLNQDIPGVTSLRNHDQVQ